MPTNKPFIVANVRDIIESWEREDISFSRMVEMFNEVAEKYYVPIVIDNDFTLWVVVNKWEYDYIKHEWFNSHVRDLSGVFVSHSGLYQLYKNLTPKP